ncbi:MAG: LPS export ABC transporter periplasmic protein LptC, partial [Candidatus Omnitrophica bacterium]|nr:LPS export ABC transporter periplasmic protein LptC [Candidatus Omnitrophota bacterium]
MTYNYTNSAIIRLCAVFLLTAGIFIPVVSTAASESSQDPQQEIKDFSVAGFGEKGKRNWDMTGKSADMSDSTIRLNDIQGNLYTDTEKVRLSADKGNFDKTQETVHLEKNVVITTDSGAKLTTDSMDWDRKKQLIETKDVVNLEKGNITSVAQGATGRPDLNKFNLEKDVRVTIDPASSEKRQSVDGNEIVINCDGPLEVDYQNNVAVFKNNVTVEMRESRIE